MLVKSVLVGKSTEFLQESTGVPLTAETLGAFQRELSAQAEHTSKKAVQGDAGPAELVTKKWHAALEEIARTGQWESKGYTGNKFMGPAQAWHASW
jgi:hypothetical protein